MKCFNPHPEDLAALLTKFFERNVGGTVSTVVEKTQKGGAYWLIIERLFQIKVPTFLVNVPGCYSRALLSQGTSPKMIITRVVRDANVFFTTRRYTF